jgi:hypothetical protein
VGIINDLHYEPFYQSGSDVQRSCRSNNSPLAWITGFTALNASPFGEYGCDAPERLINLMLDKLNEIDPNIDVLLVSGDFVAHGLTVEVGDFLHDQYAILKESITKVFLDMINKKFPNAIVLPAVGNNDIKFHYVAPTQNHSAPDYYPFLYDLFFEKLTKNSQIDKTGINETFTKFGGYRYDFSANLSFISFNSLYYNDRTPSDEIDIKEEQFAWLSSTLDNAAEGHRFVIFMHIYPGVYHVGFTRFFWDRPSVIRFDEIIQKHYTRIALITGAHSHYPDVKVGFSHELSIPQILATDEHALKSIPTWAMLITPAISPIYKNNPGVTHLLIDNNIVTNVSWTFLQLNMYPQTESEAVFYTFDFAKEMQIVEFTPLAVLKFIKSIINDKVKLYKYLAHKIGYTGERIADALIDYKKLKSITFGNECQYFCASLNILRTNYYYCVESSEEHLDTMHK